MRFKKFLPLFMACAMIGGVFAGCSNSSSGGGDHEHKYEGATFIDDAESGQHYQICTVTGCGEKKYGNHTYANGNSQETCDNCSHANPDYSTGGGGGGGGGASYKAEFPIVDAPATSTDESTALATGTKIYLVGDSTVCAFNDKYYLPRYGYGTQISQYLNVAESQVVNLALSGRSSKSFVTDTTKYSGDVTYYKYLTTNIKSGDYLIIGFGHNDEKSAEPARFCDPKGNKDTATISGSTSFKWQLYEKYIKIAKDKGATPILCTPIVRYASNGDYTGAKAHITTDGDYAGAIRALGEETDTAVVDLTGRTKKVYTDLGEDAQYFHAFGSYHTENDSEIKKPATTGGDVAYTGTEVPEGRDDTHINKYGAKMVAYQFAKGLQQTDCDLKNCVKTDSVAPTKADSYLDAINKKFVKLAYPGFSEDGKTPLAKTPMTGGTEGATKKWFKTAMGDLGGNDKLGNFSATYEGGTFTVGNSSGHGKITTGGDGFAAAFTQVSVNDNFTVRATVKVKSLGTNVNNQSAFGIMLRDDIYIDTNNNTILSNYVAAGVLNKNGAIFSRESQTLVNPEGANAFTTVVAENATYELEIQRIGQTVNVKVGSYTKTYTDFDFVARDSNYMYICLFSTRGIMAEFTNVTYSYDGVAQGA